MKWFVRYIAATGDIVGTGFAPDIGDQVAGAGLSLLEVTQEAYAALSPVTHRVADGAVVPKSPGAAQAAQSDAAWADIRRRRDTLLKDSDWVSVRALETGVPAPSHWLAYRQALRDITNSADPLTVQFPVRP